jgi:hypothetical protein
LVWADPPGRPAPGGWLSDADLLSMLADQAVLSRRAVVVS